MNRSIEKRIAALEEEAAKEQPAEEAREAYARIRGIVMEELCEDCQARFIEAEQRPPALRSPPGPGQRDPTYYTLRHAILAAIQGCSDGTGCRDRIVRRLHAAVKGDA